MNTISELQINRLEIDRIDEELVRLLNRRAVFVREIARIKQAQGLPIRIPEREAEVKSRVREANQGPLADDALTRVFDCIIEESRRLEHSLIEKDQSSC